MNNFLKTIIAGYGAKKLGGGCLSTILVFIIIYWALGNCNCRAAQPKRADIHTAIPAIEKNIYVTSKTYQQVISLS